VAFVGGMWKKGKKGKALLMSCEKEKKEGGERRKMPATSL